MARRKRRATRRYAPRRRYSKRSRAKGMLNQIGPVKPSAMAYGAVREKISNALAPLTNKIPLGTIADEAALATIAWFISKRVGGGFGRQFCLDALTIENARVGEALADGSAFAGFRAGVATGGGVPVV